MLCGRWIVLLEPFKRRIVRSHIVYSPCGRSGGKHAATKLPGSTNLVATVTLYSVPHSRWHCNFLHKESASKYIPGTTLDLYLDRGTEYDEGRIICDRHDKVKVVIHAGSDAAQFNWTQVGRGGGALEIRMAPQINLEESCAEQITIDSQELANDATCKCRGFRSALRPKEKDVTRR